MTMGRAVIERKYVYLFELDSVRMSDEEVLLGQQKLYDEIVHEGNIVVLTYNQLVDSRGFFSLLSDAAYYDSFMKLFEQGCIRVSQYGDERTISQYLLDALDEDKQFIFSALPLKFTQKRLIALVRRSLMYSDLSELSEYFEGGRRSEEELWDLFLEVKCDSDGRVLSIREENGRKSVAGMRLVIRQLYHFLSLVLGLSTMHSIYIPPRKLEEIKGLRMHHILSCALEMDCPEMALWDEAARVLRSLPCYQKQSDGRSVYHRQILAASRDAADMTAYRLAEAVIDLCYNYACEISICNTSKHYNVSELLGDRGRPSFEADFQRCLFSLWQDGMKAESRFLKAETDECIPFEKPAGFPDFVKAVRMAGYTTYSSSGLSDGVPRYEYEERKQKEEQQYLIQRGIRSKLLFSCLCFFVACLVELCMQGIQNVLDDYIEWNDIFYSVAETLAFLFITECVSACIARKYPRFLSLSEALGGMKTLLKDGMSNRVMKELPDEQAVDVDFHEAQSGEAPIDFVKTKEINSYLAYKRSGHRGMLFAASGACPIAEIEHEKILRQVIRDAEIFHHRYGLIYKSPFNTLLVDPIVGADCHFFPFERVLPTAGNGVVMVPRLRDRYILLHQFRHALRGMQYAFPRGYAEPGSSPLENVKRELGEELEAVVTRRPLSLGFIEPDSGLTSRRIEVFLVDIDSYIQKKGYEDIEDVQEVSLDELKQMIDEGKIADGYTLGAVELMERCSGG